MPGYLDAILSIVFGIYFGLMGYRIIPVSKKKNSQKMDEWHAKWGKFLKIASPILIVIGIVKFIIYLAN